MPASTLSLLQTQVLEGFFRRNQQFFLTGGAALAGFYLGHRTTEDLDLFTTGEALDEGDATLDEVARELGASVEAVRSRGDFRRRLVRRAGESVVVDLVIDRSPQAFIEKARIGAVRVDPVEEIQANKLCTLLSRSEIRDLVDVYELDRLGHRIEQALPLAARKDAGMTPAQLAWVLSQIQIGDGARLPGGVEPGVLRTFLAELQARLRSIAWPS